jgi:hypothetical protein
VADGVNKAEFEPNRLPKMTAEEVKARAQRILDLRGMPPYGPMTWQQSQEDGPPYHITTVTDDEAALISEFVYFWLPFLDWKGKKIPDGLDTLMEKAK